MSDSIRVAGDGTTNVGGITVNTPYDKKDKGVSVDDFLNLMIAQLSNQDFMNPVDDTQYVTQLAQFATMSSMQELSHYTQNSYVLSLVGKTVTAASYGLGGAINKQTGVVSKVTLGSSGDYVLTVNGKPYSLSQIMTIDNNADGTTKTDLEAANKMSLITQSVSNNSASFRWDAPVSDTTGLVYDLYYTTDGKADFNDLQVVKKGTPAATGLKEGEFTLNNLDPGTTYFVNVVVRNASGDEAVYQRSLVTTKS